MRKYLLSLVLLLTLLSVNAHAEIKEVIIKTTFQLV